MQFVRTYGTQIHAAGRDREGRDRVVIRNATRWPAVVALLQQAVDFTGVILSLGCDGISLDHRTSFLVYWGLIERLRLSLSL